MIEVAGRLAALGVDPSRVFTLPMWMLPVWARVVERAERERDAWGRIDAVHVINALGEAM